MSSEKTYVDAVIELGRNSVLAGALTVFSVSAQLTPSLLTSVKSWSWTGKLSFFLAMFWALIIVFHFARTLGKIVGKSKFSTIHAGIVGIGAGFVFGIMLVSASWAANNVALTYCSGKPDPQYAKECEKAHKIP